MSNAFVRVKPTIGIIRMAFLAIELMCWSTSERIFVNEALLKALPKVMTLMARQNARKEAAAA